MAAHEGLFSVLSDKDEAVFVDVSGVMTNDKNGSELYVAAPTE